MKKQTTSPAKVAAKVKIDLKSGTYLLKTTPYQCIDIVQKLVEKGLNINYDTRKCPYDSDYPNLLWENERLFNTKQGATSGINYGVKTISIEDFLAAIEHRVSNRITLSDDYIAEIHKDVIEVGCQKIPVDTVKQIIELHTKLYGKAK